MKQGWTYKKVGDICEVTDFVANGSFATLKQNVTYYDEPNFAILVRLADYSTNFDSSKFVYVDEHAYNFLAKSKLYGGEVIMSNVGSIGKCFLCPILDKPMTIGPNSLLIRTPNNRFYLYYFRSETFIKDLHSITSSATLSKFNKTQLKTLSIPVPSDIEQERIVERLDAAFAQIDELKSNAERQLAEARALFQSALTQAMQPKPGWQVFSFSQLIKLKSGDNLPAKSFVEGEYPVYGGNGIAGYHNQYNKEGGQIVIGRVGALCGNVRFIESPFWLTDNGFEVILDKEHKMDLPFLTYLLNFCNLRQYARQAAQPVISNVSLKDIQLNIPPVSEQQIIVEHLDALSNHVKELEEISRKTAAECDAFKQALLRQIFE